MTRASASLAAVLLAPLLISSPASPATTVPADTAVPSLPGLCVDRGAISVSGVSSGGFMAQQFHVAHSNEVMGAAIFAAGPYQCAGDDFPWSLWRSVTVCASALPLVGFQGPPDLARTLTATRDAEAKGLIDSTQGLRGDRVFLFTGEKDEFVPRPVMDTLQAYYREFDSADDIAYVTDVPAAHAMVTTDFGNACDALKPPFINACHFDLAGAALHHIYGDLAPAREPSGTIYPFDQQEFRTSPDDGLSAKGYVYIPDDCVHHSGCRLHVAFHGCQQNAETIGEAFVQHAGYNSWADTNRIVVLYPQTGASSGRFSRFWPNPQGCWDWWGFTGTDFATRQGAQITAINTMIERLSQGRADGATPCPAAP